MKSFSQVLNIEFFLVILDPLGLHLPTQSTFGPPKVPYFLGLYLSCRYTPNWSTSWNWSSWSITQPQVLMSHSPYIYPYMLKSFHYNIQRMETRSLDTQTLKFCYTNTDVTIIINILSILLRRDLHLGPPSWISILDHHFRLDLHLRLDLPSWISILDLMFNIGLPSWTWSPSWTSKNLVHSKMKWGYCRLTCLVSSNHLSRIMSI